MALRIEDYAVVADTQTAALVGRDGSIDWLCASRFDSPACFAALLGDEDHGIWRIAPAGGATATTRRYRGQTLELGSHQAGRPRLDASAAISATVCSRRETGRSRTRGSGRYAATAAISSTRR